MPEPTLAPDLETRLLAAARMALAYGVRFGRAWQPDLEAVPVAWREPGASFVTLRTRQGSLRGCVGSIEARRPLILDVAENAYRAACNDPRFVPLAEEELAETHLHLSLLGPLEKIDVSSETELCAALEPRAHGLLLRHPDGQQATFLPAVWESLPEPEDFVAALQRKAGAAPGTWRPGSEAYVYRTHSVG